MGYGAGDEYVGERKGIRSEDDQGAV